MASELRVNTLKDASGNNSVATSTVAEGTAKFWASFNGTGTAAIRDSFNSSSLTDNGTGNFTSTYANAMNNISYCIDIAASRYMSVINDSAGFSGTDPTTTTVRIGTYNSVPQYSDGDFTSVKVTGDLA